MRYSFDLSPYGGPKKLAKRAGISRMTLWRALSLVQCSPETAKRIDAATDGRIKAAVLLGVDHSVPLAS